MSDIDIPVAPVAATGEPVKLKGLHRSAPTQIGTGHRSIKMLRPICADCAPNTALASGEWWKDCPHDPYVGEKGETTIDRTYEDDPSGGRVVSGETSKTVLRPWPNYVPVSLVRRIGGGRGPEFKRQWHGYILPEELRSSSYPNGIAASCEYYECYWQDNLKTYQVGVFCKEDEAVAVYQDTIGRTVEVANMEIASDQFEADRAKVRAS